MSLRKDEKLYKVPLQATDPNSNLSLFEPKSTLIKTVCDSRPGKGTNTFNNEVKFTQFAVGMYVQDLNQD